MTDHKAARKRFSPPAKADLQAEAVRALLAACQLMIDGDWITACAAARAAIAQAEKAGITAEGE